MRISLFLLLWLQTFLMLAQTPVETQADFMARWEAPNILFAPMVPPLTQIAGAPTAYYEYYWEFGDGTFNFADNPAHSYADTSRKEVYLLATGKYDNGKAPKSRKKKIDGPKEKPKALVADVQPTPTVLEDATASMGLRAVRNPRAGEELVCILAYANHTPVTQSGKLYFFFNQKSYKNDHFNFLEARTHYGETEEKEALTWVGSNNAINGWTGIEKNLNWYNVSLPDKEPTTALSELKNKYKTSKSWSFNGLQTGEERNLFISINANDQMLADTNAIITVTGLLISDDQRVVEEYTLEMEIVASHDPNYIAVSQKNMNFRRIRSKDLAYKVHFQNNGEGPASTIQITCDVPVGLDASGLQVLDLYPKCLLCPETEVNFSCLDTSFQEGKVIFTFKNIYLPGTRQEGVSDRDSTKGFVKYRLLPNKKIRKLSFDSRASIVFDKNLPIETNRTATHFKPGISPGIMAGWNIFPDKPNRNYFSIGISLAPFKPYRRFLQVELWTGFPISTTTERSSLQDSTSTLDRSQGTLFIIDSVTTITRQTDQNPLYFNVVPLQLRKNFTNWIGAGIGVMLNVERQRNQITEQRLLERKIYRTPEANVNIPRNQTQPLTDLFTQQTTNSSSSTKEWAVNASIFADIYLGLVRQGPALGVRSILQLEENPNWYLSLFASWKL